MSESKQIISFEVDQGMLFDGISATGDGGQSVGARLATVLLGGGVDFFDAVGLAYYGISILPPATPTSETAS